MRLNWLKYIIFILVFAPLILAVHSAGGFTTIDPFYHTEHGISIAKEGAHAIFYGQITFITIFAISAGRCGFCHYFCPIAVMMIIGRNIKNLVGWPALRLVADGNRCTDCGRC
jgi:ferredoxin-type protein NapH